MTDPQSPTGGASQLKSLVILFAQSGPSKEYLQQIEKMLQGESEIEIAFASAGKEASALVQKRGRALLIFNVRGKADLTEALNGLAEWGGLIKGKSLRVIGISDLNHPQVASVLMKRGCADLFPANLNQKALKHKINQSLKIVGRVAQTFDTSSSPEKSAASAADTGLTEKKEAPVLHRTPALSLASDIWLMRKDQDIRRIQGRWIVDLIGPGPSAGLWDESENGAWEWRPKTTEHSKDFITDSGAWMYKGRKPEFVWDIGRWRFLGDSPELYFSWEGKVIATRFKLVEKTIHIAENSSQAKAKLPAIIKTIEIEVRFKSEQRAKATETEIEDEGTDAGTEETVAEEVAEEIPFNQAPKPQLKITLRSVSGQHPVDAGIVELGQEFLVLEIPSDQFKAQQQVIVVIDDGLGSASSKRNMDATLREILESANGSDTIRVEIGSDVEMPFQAIQQAIDDRQAEIFNFLKAARGW